MKKQASKAIRFWCCIVAAGSLSACNATNTAPAEQEKVIVEAETTIVELEESTIDKTEPVEESEEILPTEEAEVPEEILEEYVVECEELESPKGDFPDEEIFMQYLNGEREAILGEDFQNELWYAFVVDTSYEGEEPERYYSFDGIATLSCKELMNAFRATPDLDTSQTEIYYAIVGTLSGKKVLAIKFQGIGLYEAGDDSDALFVLAANEGELYVTYAYDSWCRKYTEIYKHLVFEGTASGGAGDNYERCGYIDETGHYESVYDLRMLTSMWAAGYDYDDFGSDDEWSKGLGLYLLTTSAGTFYGYEADESVDSEKLAILLNYVQEQGMSRVDNIDKAIADAYKANGVPQNKLTLFEDWISLE